MEGSYSTEWSLTVPGEQGEIPPMQLRGSETRDRSLGAAGFDYTNYGPLVGSHFIWATWFGETRLMSAPMLTGLYR